MAADDIPEATAWARNKTPYWEATNESISRLGVISSLFLKLRSLSERGFNENPSFHFGI
jgi:hypothetical protein